MFHFYDTNSLEMENNEYVNVLFFFQIDHEIPVDGRYQNSPVLSSIYYFILDFSELQEIFKFRR